LDYTKVIILILWWRNFQLEYWRTFQLVSTHIDDFLKKTNLKFDNNPFPLLYYCDLYDWDYTKAPIHRREEYYTYMIRKSRDGTDIETFDIAINSRGSGAPPYEGPEYEKYINIENQ